MNLLGAYPAYLPFTGVRNLLQEMNFRRSFSFSMGDSTNPIFYPVYRGLVGERQTGKKWRYEVCIFFNLSFSYP